MFQIEDLVIYSIEYDYKIIRSDLGEIVSLLNVIMDIIYQACNVCSLSCLLLIHL